MGYVDGIVKTFLGMPGGAIICQDWKDDGIINFFLLSDMSEFVLPFKIILPAANLTESSSELVDSVSGIFNVSVSNQCYHISLFLYLNKIFD